MAPSSSLLICGNVSLVLYGCCCRSWRLQATRHRPDLPSSAHLPLRHLAPPRSPPCPSPRRDADPVPCVPVPTPAPLSHRPSAGERAAASSMRRRRAPARFLPLHLWPYPPAPAATPAPATPRIPPFQRMNAPAPPRVSTYHYKKRPRQAPVAKEVHIVRHTSAEVLADLPAGVAAAWATAAAAAAEATCCSQPAVQKLKRWG